MGVRRLQRTIIYVHTSVLEYRSDILRHNFSDIPPAIPKSGEAGEDCGVHGLLASRVRARWANRRGVTGSLRDETPRGMEGLLRGLSATPGQIVKSHVARRGIIFGWCFSSKEGSLRRRGE
jgi:hypothetical protein